MSEYLRIILTIPILSVLTLSIEGCGKKEEPKAPAQAPAPTAEAKAPQLAPAVQPPAPAEPQAAAQAPAAAPSTTPPAPAPAPAAQPAPQAPQAKPALASADGENPGARVEVTELKRASGGTVMFRFTMINDGDKDLSLYSGYIPAGDRMIIPVSAECICIDPVGKKKYLVVRDSQGTCDCSQRSQRHRSQIAYKPLGEISRAP